ncbi:MAG: sigma-70 family RNA polymerase sigma factor [Candidatus Aminicenantes bacterium]|nr:sigma-70 family RNA polymerase sigma factor [Candidatus Aminicenantes bacterium]
MVNLQEKTDAVRKENELIRLFKSGSEEAFTRLIVLYQQQVFKVAYGFFRDRDDAMEIVQETFLRVYQKIDRFDKNSSFKNWVYRIAYNLCIDFYRKFKNKKSCDREIYELDEARNLSVLEPEDHIDRRDFKESLDVSLQSLSKRQKMIFVLKHNSGLKYREIADILDVSVGTVKSLHHRATQALKKKLAHYEVTA